MMYFLTPRIESFMINTGRTGAQLNYGQEHRHLDGKRHRGQREEVGPGVVDSTLAILISAALPKVVPVVSTSSKRCLVARAEGVAPVLVAARMSKLSWNYHSRKRTGADDGHCRCRWPTLVRLVPALD